MKKMDESIPGDTPETWRQYGRIGRVFTTVERTLRETSIRPTIPHAVHALAVAQNVVVIAGRAREAKSGHCFVAAHAKADGKVLWKIDLPAEPQLGGLSIDREGTRMIRKSRTGEPSRQ